MKTGRIVLLTGIAVGISAQASTLDMENDSTLWLDGVTVTSIKQSPNLRLQPVAATVLNRSEIQRWGVQTMKNVSEIAPNFYIPDYGSRMTSSIYVRGIGARMDQPVVGLSVDNVPFINKDNYDFDVLDIDRMEVFRGPQSTLYGRNTMCGQINISTISPMDYQGIRALLEYVTGPGVRVGVSHYAKLSPRLGMSLSGDFRFDDGYYRNEYNNSKTGVEKSGNLRWKTQWHPLECLKIDNVASVNINRQSGYPYKFIDTGRINYNDTCFYRRNSFNDGLTVMWQGNSFILSSITSVQYSSDNMTLDQDFLPEDYFTLTQKRHEWAVTQDIVARGAGDIYSWLTGVFGFYRGTDMRAPVTFKQTGIDELITGSVNSNPKIPVRLEWDEPSFVLGSKFSYPVYGLAIYHQSSVNLGRWNLALGARLDYESARLRYHSTCNTGLKVYMKSGIPPMPLMTSEVDINEKGRLKDYYLEFLPKFTAKFNLPMSTPSNVYASVGKGYKAGGFNTQMFSDILQQRMMQEMMSQMPGNMGGASTTTYNADDILSYKPEKSWNYEIGAHIGCADGKVLTDLALFYIDCNNQQLTMYPEGSTTGRITTNAGRTRSYGVEAQITYRPTQRWSFNIDYGYTDARFKKFSDGRANYKGKYVPFAPQNTLFVSASHILPLQGWIEKLAFNANIRGVGRIYWNEANSVSQPFYMQLGASVSATHKDFSLEAWVENLTDKHFSTMYFESVQHRFLQQGKPRRFGITVRLNFDTYR